MSRLTFTRGGAGETVVSDVLALSSRGCSSMYVASSGSSVFTLSDVTSLVVPAVMYVWKLF